jgi:hypothetical protein
VPRSIARSLENMLNNERKFPKREPVWKPLFDIYLLSLFFRTEKIGPLINTAERLRRSGILCRSQPRSRAELSPASTRSLQEKPSLRSSLRIIRVGPLRTNALRTLAGTLPLSYYSHRPGKRVHKKFIRTYTRLYENRPSLRAEGKRSRAVYFATRLISERT